jgi:hypothetical protein
MARTYNSGWRDWFNTKSADINGNFVVEGLVEQMKQLDALLASNPDMEKRMQNVIRKVLTKAQSKMRKDVSTDLPRDPRNAAKAVRKAVYRRLLGGNINILRKRRATEGASSYTPTRTLKSGQRGGNRRLRNERTMRMDSYSASDRGFILFWLNSGTQARNEKGFKKDPHRSAVKRGSQGGDISKYGKTTNSGARGKIAARNVFASHIISLGEFIDKELIKEFGDLMQSQTK